MTHRLEIADVFAELLALIGVLDGVIKCSLGDTDHLRCNADTSLVENLNGNLVSFANLADDILLGNLDIVKGQDTGGRRADTELPSARSMRRPTFFSFLAISTPISLDMMKQVMPLYPADGSTLAKTCP